MFSRRSAFEQRKNRLELARAAAVREGKILLDLTESNPTRAQLPRLAQAIAGLSRGEAQLYAPEPFGLRSAREAASEWMAKHALPVPPERIVLTASTSEAYAFLFKLLCDEGDEVLVPAPSYPLFAHLAQLEGVRVGSYALAYDGRWHAPLDVLRAACTPRTRAIVTVHPNNPTGSFLTRAELTAIGRLALPLISDEVFAPYPLTLDAERAPSALYTNETLVFTLHGLSKLAGLPQLKLSFMCVGGPEVQVEQALARLEIIADSFLSVATPVQLALPEILATHAPITEAIRERLARNLALLARLSAGTAASLLHVEGGWYAVLRLPDVLDDEAWALELIARAQTLVQPGYFYDFTGGPYVVLSLLTPEAVFETGVQRMLATIDAVAGG